jgi:flagellar protein FlhE
MLVAPAYAHAMDTGSWSKDSAGGVLKIGNQIMTSQRLTAPNETPRNATVVRMSWHISLLTSPPAGLQIKLCHPGGCKRLNGLSGEFTPDTRWPANTIYHFVYSVQSKGTFRPTLNVVRNHLTVNYQ